MPVKVFLKTYLTIFLPLASPFFILSACLLIFPINHTLISSGYCFSLLMSLFLTANWRVVGFSVKFERRDEYLKTLTELLEDLGYTLTHNEGLLTTFESRDSHFVSREINVYLFKDSALILAPKRYSAYLQQSPQTKLSLLLRYFA
ncbi:hypothetical protein REC12_25165 [Desulfosporosinus sp. PR]|uniref:hypothetical protein n=1 Tax=Candidatus Desulfosporosinus nitrosoreducens TaxID=3401928 RepID=UPI0027F88292|nr:hypothetical protein [Desulfosporosinus sp. PR]MDQ7096889.1 hypothetical protein [Desulfosporosinus sp. PR]